MNDVIKSFGAVKVGMHLLWGQHEPSDPRTECEVLEVHTATYSKTSYIAKVRWNTGEVSDLNDFFLQLARMTIASSPPLTSKDNPFRFIDV